MKKCFYFLALAAIFVAGCNQPPKPEAPAAQPDKPTAATDTAKAPDVSEVGADFKTDAYNFYGLDCTKTLTYKLTETPKAPDKTGSQKVVYKGMKDGNPTFDIVRDGDLATLIGDDSVVVKKDGVYSTTAGAYSIDPPMLALPAKLVVGATWPSKQDVKSADGKPIKFDMTNKVLRQEKFKSAVGEFDCFVIETSGNIVNGDKKTPVNGTSWYAKDYGAVKMTLKTKDKNGVDVNFNIELTSQG